jgi:hypothetical protein
MQRAAAAERRRARSAYADAIFGPTNPSPMLATAQGDTARYLEQLTGKRVASQSGTSDRGIVLVRTDGLVEPGEAEKLAGKGPEAFLLRSKDDQLLRVVANGDAGLAYGLYFYLRELGFRWFLPGEAWTIVPTVPSIAVHIDRVVVPAFRQRTFFGTGGFGPPSPVDGSGEAQKRSAIWSLRNGFGGEFVLGGHVGEAFSLAHRGELEQHPEYLALVAGKRVPWSTGARYCVSSPGLQRLFVADRLAALERILQKDPASPSAFAISVEPADRSGGCECDRCRAIGQGTESDQVFFLANVVARALRARHPHRYVSLLAYSQHAAPPAISLEPNVFVIVVPEAFQTTGLDPDALVNTWRSKASRLSVYTYWSIPDWAFDQPTMNFRQTPEARLRDWHRAGVEGIALESTYGAGASGIALYLAGQLMWNPEQDAAPLLDEFYRLAFREAAAPMRRMIERWGAKYMPIAHEIGASYHDLAEARRKARGDAEATARVRAYEEYLHYLRLWMEYRDASHEVSRARALVTWLYRVHDTDMIGSHRMRSLILNRFTKDPGLAADFLLGNPSAPGWKLAREPVGDQELGALMKDGALAYPPPTFADRVYSGRLVRPREGLPDDADESRPLVLAGPTDFEILVAPGRRLELEISIKKHPTIPFESLTVRAEDGKLVHEERIPPDGLTHRVQLEVPHGRYTCHVQDQKATFTLRGPQGQQMTTGKLTSTDASPRIYFWVPAGLRKIAMYVPSVSPIELLDANGLKVQAPGSGLVVADVPEGQDGRAWSFRRYKSWFPIAMINLPQAFARSPGALLVPEDAAGAR